MSAGLFASEFPRENEYIEFKAGVGRDAIHRTVTAFSNTDGGVLILGVTDRGEIAGRSLTGSVETDITHAILGIHNPGRYWLYELDVEGKTVIVVSVAKREQGFAQTSDGQLVVRKGAHSVPLVGGELVTFLSSRSLSKFEMTPTDVPLSSADGTLLNDVGSAFRWSDGPTPDSLAAEKLVTQEGGETRLTVAGALTLLADPSASLGKTYIEILRFRDESVNYDRRLELKGPVQRQVVEATEFIMNELGADLIVSGIRRHELPKLPEVAVREAVANAVAHRSYEEVGRSVRIELRPGRVVIESPGGLPEPVTELNIRDTQSARNISVIKVLRRLKLAEDSGRGIDVMQDSMAEALLDPPVIRDLDHSVQVTLPVQGAISPQERAWILEVERRGSIAPRDRLLLIHAARGESLTNEGARQLLGCDSRDARRALQRLKDAGFLVQIGERGGAHYLLSEGIDAPAAFRLPPSALRDLVLSLAEGAPLTNASVRAATGLERAEALRLLDSLVSEGRLIRHGERRGTRYVAP
jgi:ATP-dependent DNA helicase RecG